jgi:hypothetical protein
MNFRRFIILVLLSLSSAGLVRPAAAEIYSFTFNPWNSSQVSGSGTATITPIFAGIQTASDVAFSFSDGSFFNTTNFQLTALYTPDYMLAGFWSGVSSGGPTSVTLILGSFYSFTDEIGNVTDGSFTVKEIAAAVPEPSTWAMMILGFAGVSYMTYRRRKVAALTA